MSKWPFIKVGEILTQIDRFEPVNDGNEYRLLGVRLDGAGPFLRETVSSTETSANRLNRVKVGDFIYSRLFAWRGAFGVIPEKLDGCFVSNEFPIFRINEKFIDSGFINYWFRLPAVWKQVEDDCSGSTPLTRNRFKEQFFFELQIPTPPLDEQQTIVSRLDAVAEKVRQVEAKLDEIEADADALIISLHYELSAGRNVRLGDILELSEIKAPVLPDVEYPQVGLRGFGGGLFAKPAICMTDTTYKAFNQLYLNAIVLSQVKGWEGALAVCTEAFAGMYASPEYRTFSCLPDKASPAYLGELIRTPWFWNLLQNATHGVGARRERTRPEQFLEIVLPMPIFENQVKAAQIVSRLKATKSQHTETRLTLKALLPSMLEQIFN